MLIADHPKGHPASKAFLSLQGWIKGEGAGGSHPHPPPPSDDLQLSHTTGILSVEV